MIKFLFSALPKLPSGVGSLMFFGLFIVVVLESMNTAAKLMVLEKENLQLEAAAQESRAANLLLAQQYQRLAEAMENAANNKEIAEKRSYDLRKQIKQAQLGTDCATAPVPADALRMQREAIEATNNAATTTSANASVPAP